MTLDAVEQIKDRLPLLEYLQRESLGLKREGTTYKACCPFHGEKTGSFTVWPKRDSWHCFGCDRGGDLFTYYQMARNCDFKEALKALASEAGVQLHESPEQQERVRLLRERSEILLAAARHYHAQLQAPHRAYLHGRGFKDEFIDSYLFGYTPGNCIREALKGVTVERLKEIGLVTDQGRDFFWRRIVIPVYGRPDSVVNLVGRRWVEPGEVDDGIRKYLRLPGEEQLINEGALKGASSCYLCEGDTDTPTLIQAGLTAVGAPGTCGLKEEWAEKFARVEHVYVCADGDEHGLKLIHQAGRLFGNRCRVVVLPDGEDVNSWVGQKGNDITGLAREAKPYLEWLMGRLPSELPAGEADRVLEPALAALSRCGKAAQDLYAKQIAKRFGLTVAAVREAVRERGSTQNGHDKDSKAKLTDSKIVWKMPRLVNPAQDLVDGVMLTTVFLDSIEVDPETKAKKIVTLPHVVTSKREVFLLSDMTMWDRGWRFAKTKVPALGILSQRWSTDEAAPHGVKQYLDAKVTVEPWAVYQDVVDVFRRYVDYPNDLYYDFIAIWVIATYWFNLYPAFPYLHFLGFKRTGKSRTLEIIAELAFNALWSASMTAAAAYRTVEACSATLLMDEAENLRKKDKNDKSDRGDDDKLEILKAGYQRGQKAIRCSGDNNEPTGYDLYSPKAFGGTQSLDRILGDRVIPLILARRGRELEEFNVTELHSRFVALRDSLYVLMLDYGANIAEEIRSGIYRPEGKDDWKGVQDREKQLWTPILTVAQFFDKARLEVETDPASIDRAALLTRRMRRLADQKVAERIAKEQADQGEVLILEALLKFVKRHRPINAKLQKDAYATLELLNYVQQADGLKWIDTAKKLVGQLEKMTLIRSGDQDQPRVRPTPASPKVRCVRLDPERLCTLAARFGATDRDDDDEQEG